MDNRFGHIPYCHYFDGNTHKESWQFPSSAVFNALYVFEKTINLEHLIKMNLDRTKFISKEYMLLRYYWRTGPDNW